MHAAEHGVLYNNRSFDGSEEACVIKTFNASLRSHRSSPTSRASFYIRSDVARKIG